MNSLSMGDLAISFQNRQSHARIKADLQRLGKELATGVTQDLRAATGGDLGAIAGIEHAIGTMAAYKVSASEAGLVVGSVQRVLETVQDVSSDIGPAMLQASSSGQATLVQVAATDARARFATVVSALNTQVADRALLAGTSTDGPALATSENMLAELKMATAAETTAAGIETIVDAWFDTPGGGFETSGYVGSPTKLSPFRIGPDEQASLSLTADDPDLRDLMKAYAMAALVSDGALSSNHEERVALLETSATRMLTSDKKLAEMRAGIGTLEARIETATARNSAETSALEMARNEIIAVDPYKAATDLSAAQTQLETLYTVTARLSRLSLAGYL
jgi:flagellar hook-associated protein 3 FlgL